MHRRALTLRREIFGSEHLEVAASLNRLAAALENQSKYADAEKLNREALAIQRRLLVDEHGDIAWLLTSQGKLSKAQTRSRELIALNPASSSAWGTMTEFLARTGRWKEAAAEYSRLLESKPESALAWRRRGEIFAGTGHRNDAAADLARAVELAPNDLIAYRMLAPLLIANGQLESYRQLCQKMLTHFGDTKDPGTADNTAKDCLILASSGVDLNVVDKLAEIAVALGHGSEYLPWFRLCKALSEYRQGRFTNAADWVNKALAAVRRLPERDAAAYLVLAMAKLQLQDRSAALLASASAKEIVNGKLSKLDGADLGHQWLDRIIVNIRQV